MSTPDWRALRRPGRIVDTGRVRLWADEEGDGEPLVLVGGFGAGHHIWDLVWPLLPEYRRVTLEPRGLGRSDRPDGPYGEQVWADDLAALLDALGVGRAHVWATGFGTYYAIRFAADRPERVGALVGYTDVWAGDPAKAYGKIWKVYGTIVETFGTTGFGAHLLQSMFSVPGEEWFPEWEAANLAETLHEDTAARTAGHCLTEADVRADLPRLRAPVLVLQGDADWQGGTLDPEADGSLRLMRTAVPGLEVEVVEGAHPAYVLVQQPERCAEIVRAFLARHPL